MEHSFYIAKLWQNDTCRSHCGTSDLWFLILEQFDFAFSDYACSTHMKFWRKVSEIKPIWSWKYLHHFLLFKMGYILKRHCCPLCVEFTLDFSWSFCSHLRCFVLPMFSLKFRSKKISINYFNTAGKLLNLLYSWCEDICLLLFSWKCSFLIIQMIQQHQYQRNTCSLID
jgi:hypothetical protein